MRVSLALVAAGLVAGCNSAPSGPVTETGELATGDRMLTQGEFIDSYTVRMTEGQWVKVDLRSTAFDPYLILRTPGGQNSDNDDAVPGDREHSQIVYRATESGQFEIGVTSYASGESGAYTLVYDVTDTQPQSVAATGAPRGESAPGTLGDETAEPDPPAPAPALPEPATPDGDGSVKI